MPHIIVEYKLKAPEQARALVDALHIEAMAIPAFPLGGLRVRAYAPQHCRVADGRDDRYFAYVTIRIGQGRDAATKTEIGERLFGVLTDWAQPLMEGGVALSLGLEIQEINSPLSWKKNNIHDMLKDQTNDS